MSRKAKNNIRQAFSLVFSLYNIVIIRDETLGFGPGEDPENTKILAPARARWDRDGEREIIVHI